MISVILPTYNEKDNIVFLINSIIKILNGFNHLKYEIIVVDDNSPDGTRRKVEEITKTNNSIKLIVRINKLGLASAIKEGIKSSNGDYVIHMDTDLSHPPEYIKTLIDTSLNLDIDTVIASRFVKGGKMDSSKFKYYCSKIMNHFVRALTDLEIKDLTGGYFIIKKLLLDKINLDQVFIGYGDYFFRLFYELKKFEYSYQEIPYTYKPRKSGESKTRIFRNGLGYILTAISLRFRS